jgi:hypothetical protein
MFTKTAARLWALTLTIESLRRKAEHLKTGDLGVEARQKDIPKGQNALRELADKLDLKRQKLLTRQRLTEEKRHGEG